MTALLVDRSKTALVLAAIVLGLVLGAMTCAAGLSDGNGHATHAAAEPAVAESEQTIHPTEHGSLDHRMRVTQSATMDGDTSSAPPVEGHPGMACLVPVDLRFLGPTVAASSDGCQPFRPVALADRTGELDPPVPRSS